MEKAAKLLTTVLALWLSAATWANGADTFEEPTKITALSILPRRRRPRCRRGKRKPGQTRCWDSNMNTAWAFRSRLKWQPIFTCEPQSRVTRPDNISLV